MKRVLGFDLSTATFGAVLVVALGGIGAAAGCHAHTGEPAGAVRAFRYSVDVEVRDYWAPISFHQSGEVVLPDAEHVTTRLVVDSLDTTSELIRMGDARWVRGDLPFVDFGMSPLSWLGGAMAGDLRERLAGLASTLEDVDGHPAARYDLDADAFAALVAAMVSVPDVFAPPPATLWVSVETGLPLRLRVEVPLTAAPATLVLELRVSDVDDPSISIESPLTFTTGATYASAADAPATAGDGGGDVSAFERVEAFFGGVLEAITGVDPFVVEMAVDAAAEAAPSIQENIENVEEWREANPDDPGVGRAFREPDQYPEEKNWVYNWFWGLFE